VDSNVSGGITNITNGSASTVSGGTTNVANGDNSSISGGYNNLAQSFGEWVGGISGTDYVPASIIGYSATDRIFNVGNGKGADNRSDAITILKNGFASLPSVTNELISSGTLKAIVTKEYVEANFEEKIKTTAPASSTAIGNPGEIRVTPTFIYTCVAKDTWVRAATATW
jgi:hypothetical protein